ncbi:hypothetical protein CRV08_05495 [Halarcobacter ebronensis]|uniref:histidine kinase n=1 Tax=Halarcobacter ebronensis TaxID=1462615 RepID=A0A4Q0YJ25_9BACT|nr:transporter substrate-binding domain-containing protein [Halarcobacter ebronensis]RXJ68891.1 hypothetical protein CRV08_05495 [Halarcobacter ebronensis]
MNRVFRFLSILLLLTSFLYSAQTSFKVSYDPDYAPFSYLENGKPEGLLVDYWKLWAEKNNYSLEFINGKHWGDAVELVNEGKVDFFLGTNPYKPWMKASKSIYKTTISLFINKDFSKDFNLNAPYLIGIIGKGLEETTKKNFPNSEILVYKNYTTLFKDFLAKKLDLIFDDKTAIEFYSLRNGFFHKIKSLDLLQLPTPIYAISKEENLIEIFNKGFEKINQEELYDIENKWIINNDFQIYKKSFELTKEEKEFLKNHKFNVSVSKAWEPFTFVSKDNKPTGISSEIWNLFVEKLSLDCTYHIDNTFTKQLDSIKTKKNDIIFSAGETEDRKEYALFTKPYIEFPISIVTLKDENFIENVETILNKKICLLENSTAHKLLKEKYPDVDKNLILVKNTKDGLQKVIHKEAYAYIGIKPNLLYNINNLGLNELKISGNTGLTYKISIMIRKDYPLLKSALEKTIDSIDKESISDIVGKWTNIQFKEKFDYKILVSVLIIVFIIFIVLIYINQANIKRNKILKDLVDERTKELKILNQELEKRVEEKTKELIKTNYLLDEAQKIARLGSFSYNFKKKELIWSDEHFKIFGFYPNEIRPSITKFISFIHDDDKQKVKKHLFKVMHNDKRKVIEFKIILRDNTKKYLQLSTKVSKYDSNNKPQVILGTIIDLTKVKELELQKREKDSMLAQQSKMAALGEMLENIAHQWRQPLSVISTASTGLQLQIELNDEIPKKALYQSVKSINEHTQYLSKTIDDFRNFFNPRKEKVFFNISSTIEKSLSLVSSRIKKESICIIQEVEEVEIKTIESELIQILLNIFNNAIDALTQNNIEDKYIFVTVFRKNDYLHIKIKDNAGGIPKKIINRVFEPYFTTKHKYQGTGIGLYMSNEIITKHLNGVIKVSNNKFEYEEKNYTGALFAISIPISE